MVDLSPEAFGRPKAPAGSWASCIRIINPVDVSVSLQQTTHIFTGRSIGQDP